MILEMSFNAKEIDVLVDGLESWIDQCRGWEEWAWVKEAEELLDRIKANREEARQQLPLRP